MTSPVTESAEERRSQGAAMKSALERLAAQGGFASIPDPLAWQREMREDRPLPGRNEFNPFTPPPAH